MAFIHEDGSIMAVKDYPIVKILESKKAINNYTLGRSHPLVEELFGY
jgi:hypothetical protein